MDRVRRYLVSLARAIAFWLPLTVVFFGVGFAVEVSHAQATFSPHYPPAIRYAGTESRGEYSAKRVNGRWQIFALDQWGRIGLIRSHTKAEPASETVVDQAGDIASAPSMAWNAPTSLGAWGANPDSPNEKLKLVFFSRGAHRILTVTRQGTIAHPYVVANPHGGYTVLFTWQRPGQSYDIYGVELTPFGALATLPVKLASSAEFGFYPRGAWGGDGHLDVMYLEECCTFTSFDLLFRQFNRHLLPVGSPRQIEEVGSNSNSSTPGQWGLDMQAGAQGDVWASWADSQAVHLGRWDSSGRRQGISQLAVSHLDLSEPAVSLAILANGGMLYYPVLTGNSAAVVVDTFDSRGRFTSPGRVSFYGFAANPRASVSGRIANILFEVNGMQGEEFDGTSYHRDVPVSMAERLGMGVGSIPLDALFLAAGALLLAVPLTAVNGPIVIPLLLAWLPISRLAPERYRWLIHAAIVAMVLILIFAVKSFANGWALLIGPLGNHLDWLAIAGAIFVGCWVSRVGLRGQEGVFRAAGFVLGAFYFVAVMWAVGGIEARLSFV